MERASVKLTFLVLFLFIACCAPLNSVAAVADAIPSHSGEYEGQSLDAKKGKCSYNSQCTNLCPPNCASISCLGGVCFCTGC